MFLRLGIGRSAWVVGLISEGRDPVKIDGRCHCGRITFEAEVDPATVTICPAASCRCPEEAAARALCVSGGCLPVPEAYAATYVGEARRRRTNHHTRLLADPQVTDYLR
jgi:hypothetical protein